MGDIIKLVHSAEVEDTETVFECDCGSIFFFKTRNGIVCPKCNNFFTDDEICDVLRE